MRPAPLNPEPLPTQIAAPSGRVALFAAVYAATAVLSYRWTMTADGLAGLWLGNAILAAALLLLPLRAAAVAAVVAWGVDFLCGVGIGEVAPVRGALVATLDLSEAVLAAVLIRRCCGGLPDLARVGRLRAMVFRAIAPATLATAVIYVFAVRALYPENMAQVLATWFGGDLLTMIVTTPAILMLARSWRGGRGAPEWVGLATTAVLATATVAMFLQPAAAPLIVLAPLAAALTPLWLSTGWIMISSGVVALAATVLTLAGLGPMAAFAPHDMAVKLLLLQTFLAAVALGGLFSAALLREQRLARRRLARIGRARSTVARDPAVP